MRTGRRGGDNKPRAKPLRREINLPQKLFGSWRSDAPARFASANLESLTSDIFFSSAYTATPPPNLLPFIWRALYHRPRAKFFPRQIIEPSHAIRLQLIGGEYNIDCTTAQALDFNGNYHCTRYKQLHL